MREVGLPGIVYAATRKSVDLWSEHAGGGMGLRTGRYHAGMTDEERTRAQDDFLAGGWTSSWPPTPSAWAWTRPTSGSSSTRSSPAASRRTTRRSAGPAATASRRDARCCSRRPTCAPRSSSWPAPIPPRRPSARCGGSWPTEPATMRSNSGSGGDGAAGHGRGDRRPAAAARGGERRRRARRGRAAGGHGGPRAQGPPRSGAARHHGPLRVLPRMPHPVRLRLFRRQRAGRVGAALRRLRRLPRLAARGRARPLDDDELLQVRIALSAVGRLSGRFGVERVAQVLVGSRGREVLEHGLDRIPTYGKLSTMPLDQVKDLLGVLADSGLVERQGIEGGRPGAFVLALTAEGRAVARGETRPELELPAAAPRRARHRGGARNERPAHRRNARRRTARGSRAVRPPEDVAHRGGAAAQRAAVRRLPRPDARRHRGRPAGRRRRARPNQRDRSRQAGRLRRGAPALLA